MSQPRVDYRQLHNSIRHEQKLWQRYAYEREEEAEREIRPMALIYYVDNALLAAWCKLRGDSWHFRVDRIYQCVVPDATFIGKRMSQRARLQAAHRPFGPQKDSRLVSQQL